VDVYTQVRSEDLGDLLSVPLHGRYCGSDTDKLPTVGRNRLISMTNILVVGFYTMSTVDTDVKGFKANYSFIDDGKSLDVTLSTLMYKYDVIINIGLDVTHIFLCHQAV